MDKPVVTVRQSQRGYTLIEMVVVTAILLLLAALIVPNLVSLERSSAQRNRETDLRRLPIEAINLAKQWNTPMVMHMDGDALVVEADTDTTQQTSNSTYTGNRVQTSNANNSSATDVQKRVTLGDDIQIVAAQQNGDSIDSSSWRWVVQPDGSSVTSGLEFQIGSTRKSLYLPSEGPPQWIDGDLPDPELEHWDVGEIEQRTSTQAQTQ